MNAERIKIYIYISSKPVWLQMWNRSDGSFKDMSGPCICSHQFFYQTQKPKKNSPRRTELKLKRGHNLSHYDPADHPVALCPPSFSGGRRTPSSTWAFWCWPRSRTTRASSWAACASACCCCCWGRCSCGGGTNTSTVRGGARRQDTALKEGGCAWLPWQL